MGFLIQNRDTDRLDDYQSSMKYKTIDETSYDYKSKKSKQK